MGFWHTGYIEFHEPTGLSGPYIAPETPRLICQKCEQQFLDSDAFIRHRFEAHPFLQPAIHIDGVEFVASRHTLSRKTLAANIKFTNANECWLNGNMLSLSELSETIASTRQGFFSVRLKNNEGAVEAAYDFDICIPDDNDILGVEKRFFEFSQAGNLSVISVNNFIEFTKDFQSARGYVDGLSAYLYSVLAKDQRGGTSLTRVEGRARMTRALQLLSGYETPLAVVVAQTINFNLNSFNDGLSLLNAPQLAAAMRRFWCLLYPLNGQVDALIKKDDSTSKHVQLDVCSGQLIEWAMLSHERLVERKRELEKVLLDDNWGPEDRLKVQILLAHALSSVGDMDGCSVHARRIRHNPFWGRWAESLLLAN